MGAGGDQQREGRGPDGRRGRTRIGDAALTRALAAAKKGDEAAFAAVYQWVHPGLLGYVRGIVGDEAEDVASEAWLQIARDLHRFTGDGGDFRRWTAVVARNRARDHIRRRLSRPRLSLADGDALDVPDARDTAAEALAALATDDALDLVAALPPDQGRAVYLGVVIGMDGPSAARVLGKRPGAVRMALHRGLRRLRAQLTGEAQQWRPGGAAPRQRRDGPGGGSSGGGPDPGRGRCPQWPHCLSSGGRPHGWAATAVPVLPLPVPWARVTGGRMSRR